MYSIETLVRQMVRNTSELSWLEFKENNCNPQMIGEDISALANAAAYCDRPKVYMIWGVENGTHRIVGTSFQPDTCKKGNQLLEIWLRTQ